MKITNEEARKLLSTLNAEEISYRLDSDFGYWDIEKDYSGCCDGFILTKKKEEKSK